MKKKKQIVVIHGGTTFDSYDEYIHFLKTVEVSLEYLKKKSWKNSLQEKLGDDFDVVRLQMPNKINAKYDEWKIYFERYISLFDDEVILIGHSLGGIFLAKYLAENKYPKKIMATYLIAAPYDDIGLDESLGDFVLPTSLSGMSQQSKRILVISSEDDPIVPIEHAEKYKTQLPNVEVIIFKDKQHFSQAEFPELVEHIKNNF